MACETLQATGYTAPNLSVHSLGSKLKPQPYKAIYFVFHKSILEKQLVSSMPGRDDVNLSREVSSVICRWQARWPPRLLMASWSTGTWPRWRWSRDIRTGNMGRSRREIFQRVRHGEISRKGGGIWIFTLPTLPILLLCFQRQRGCNFPQICIISILYLNCEATLFTQSFDFWTSNEGTDHLLWIDICERKPPPNVSGKALAQLRQSSGLLPNGSSTALLPGSKFEASKIKRMKSQIVEDVLMFWWMAFSLSCYCLHFNCRGLICLAYRLKIHKKKHRILGIGTSYLDVPVISMKQTL